MPLDRSTTDLQLSHTTDCVVPSVIFSAAPQLGHGGDCALIVFSPAPRLFHDLVDDLPTLRAVATPQVIYTASAGYHDSIQLALIRRRIMKGDPTVMGAEWSIIGIRLLPRCPGAAE